MPETSIDLPEDGKLFEIEKAEYVSFKTVYHGGSYKHLRYGQAFYNHFAMHKTAQHQDLLGKLYEMDEKEAVEFINTYFIIK